MKMLKSLSEAKEYTIAKVKEMTDEEITQTEKEIIETQLENYLFDKISEIISEDDLEKAKLETPEAMEWYFFHTLPNYMSLLEETTSEFLSEYLSD